MRREMRQIVVLLAFVFMAAACQAQDAIHATLEANTNRSGSFVIHITNISSNTVRFLDVREGTATCGKFYEITVEKDDKQYKSQELSLYAPGGTPTVVELLPGKTYDRDIQPGAYGVSEKHFIPPCEIKVTYRLTQRIKTMWKGIDKTLNLDLRFETNQVKLESNK
jgi:hypothetical protein